MALTELATGCTIHAVPLEEAQRYWAIAEQRRANVAVCRCCLGPAQPFEFEGDGYCKTCRARGGDIGWQADPVKSAEVLARARAPKRKKG